MSTDNQNDDGTGNGSGEEVDWKARFEAIKGDEVEKWKSLARKHEDDFKKLSREAQKNTTAASELSALKAAGQSDMEKVTSLTSQHEAMQKAHEESSRERDALRVENSRIKAGMAHGLSIEDMQFIPAGTDEEMSAAAKTLSDRLGTKNARVPNFDGGGRSESSNPKTMGDVVRAERARLRERR